MNNALQFELVSFAICPYVQRSVITLKHKKVPFEITYIDLMNPPEWFEKISPLGKVPLLLVREGKGDPETLFESAVINEYIDEVTPPMVALKDPLKKAKERAWVEVAGEALGVFYSLTASDDLNEIEESKKELWETLSKVEEVLPGGETFRGTEFSLVDAAFAPVFMRMQLFKSIVSSKEWERLPKTKRWSDALMKRPEVRESVIPEFKEQFSSYLKARGSFSVPDLA